jgi:release factor glutamine methyltransferase
LTEIWTIVRILEWTADYFREQGVDSARLDAELLLSDLLDLDRVGLYLQYDKPLNPVELKEYRALVKRRAAREPIAYILGQQEFWSLPMLVSPAVLVPRGDTELLVEEALKGLETGGTVLDIGTGSGAIAIAIAHERPEVQIEAIDISAEALAVAIKNAELNGVSAQIIFRQENLAQLTGGRYDMIVSNPPYIPESDREGLMPEVRDHEPPLALFAGADGLDAYRQIVAQAPAHLVPAGWLLLEVGIHQSEPVAELLRAADFVQITVRDDYAGIPRVVCGQIQE